MDDLISRQAAIDAICKACYFYDVCYEDDERCKDVAILRDFSSAELERQQKAHKIQTNADRIRAMTDEEMAEYLYDRGNGCEYCYGICAYQNECNDFHSQEFCVEQIVKWLNQDYKGERK